VNLGGGGWWWVGKLDLVGELGGGEFEFGGELGG
jgi:hypothetical protein